MYYKIFNNGELINTIYSREDFVKTYCERNGYTYELRIDPEIIPELTETERLRADVDFILALNGFLNE